MTRPRIIPICTLCGKQMNKSNQSASKPVCLPCRRLHPQHSDRAPRPRGPRIGTFDLYPCKTCGTPFIARVREMESDSPRKRKYCSKNCQPGYNKGISKYPNGDGRRQRTFREQDAPGLGSTARKMLLAKWKRQGRACAYCPSKATTIDHVVPLYRGGTNGEGNLTPACKPCNSAKRDRYIIEWKTGRKSKTSPYMYKQRTQPKPKVIQDVVVAVRQPNTFHCKICGKPAQSMTKHTYCSDECMVENNRIINRNRYRERMGIPTDAYILTGKNIGQQPVTNQAKHAPF